MDNLSGKKFGKWLVVFQEPNRNGHTAWLCRCECGNRSVVTTGDLRSGKSTQCKPCARMGNGYRGTKIYRVWGDMMQRCRNPKNPRYARYGGRGIRVCKRWHVSSNFIEWALKNGYKEGLSLDRIDNDKGYRPENCRWSTMLEQGNNRNNNHLFVFDGVTKTVAQWAREYGICRSVLYRRIKLGWRGEVLFSKLDHRRTLEMKQAED